MLAFSPVYSVFPSCLSKKKVKYHTLEDKWLKVICLSNNYFWPESHLLHLAWNHSMNQWQSQNLNPGLLNALRYTRLPYAGYVSLDKSSSSPSVSCQAQRDNICESAVWTSAPCILERCSHPRHLDVFHVNVLKVSDLGIVRFLSVLIVDWASLERKRAVQWIPLYSRTCSFGLCFRNCPMVIKTIKAFKDGLSRPSAEHTWCVWQHLETEYGVKGEPTFHWHHLLCSRPFTYLR